MPHQAVKSGAVPSPPNRGEKANAAATVLHRAVKTGATAMNRAVQASTAPTASNKVAQPGATTTLLQTGQKTGATAILQRASASATRPQQEVRAGAAPSAVKAGEKTDTKGARLHEAAKAGVIAGTKQDEKKPGAKSISPQKLAANRRNAKRSTGPRTERGKRHSRRNPLKHGIRASALLIRVGVGAENVAEFDELLDGLRRDWKPVGKREEACVEEIAICDWRKMRALRCEAGLIRRRFVMEASAPGLTVLATNAILGRDAEDERDRELKAIKDDLSLPLGKPLDAILRYEAAIERQKARATTQLERLQLARKGEHVAAPVKVELSTDGSSFDCIT